MGSYREHQNLMNQFFLEVSKAFLGVKCFPRVTGKFIYIRFIDDLINKRCGMMDWKKYICSVGDVGMPDSYLLLPTSYGLLHIEVEFKTGNSKLSAEQKDWKKVIESIGGIYIHCRNVEIAIEELRKRVAQPN